MLDEFWDSATPDDLPGDLAEIGHLLGMDAARYFALHWSGSWPYIAAHRERSADLDEIAYALGEEAVQTLIDAFGGTSSTSPASTLCASATPGTSLNKSSTAATRAPLRPACKCRGAT